MAAMGDLSSPKDKDNIRYNMNQTTQLRSVLKDIRKLSDTLQTENDDQRREIDRTWSNLLEAEQASKNDPARRDPKSQQKWLGINDAIVDTYAPFET